MYSIDIYPTLSTWGTILYYNLHITFNKQEVCSHAGFESEFEALRWAKEKGYTPYHR